MAAYYNEVDPYAAQWLRNLIAAGHIADGDVDDRSIADVHPADLLGYDQCHFFAGIGVWSHALRRAGWPDDRPVWTGSCPRQPFSAAGKGEGTGDARHLWPEWFRLIREHRPVAIFGEQVSAAIRHGWLDLVSADLEGLDYAVGAAVLGAHSVGAPHIRQRLYFVADANGPRRGEGRSGEAGDGGGSARLESSGLRVACELADAKRGAAERHRHELGGAQAGVQGAPREQRVRDDAGDGKSTGGPVGDSDNARCEGNGLQQVHGKRDWRGENQCAAGPGPTGIVVDPQRARLEGHPGDGGDRHQPGRHGTHQTRPAAAAGSTGGFWARAEWIPCRDGKARPVEPGTFPLVNGATARVGRLRAYGNAIAAPAAEAFIRAYLT